MEHLYDSCCSVIEDYRQTDFDCCLSVMQLVDAIVRQRALEAVCLLLRLSTDTQVPGAALPYRSWGVMTPYFSRQRGTGDIIWE